MTRSEALRTRRFWQLGSILLLAAGSAGCMAVHLQSMLIDSGTSLLAAAGIFALFGPAQIVGRIGAGLLLDRIHGGVLGAIAFLCPIIGTTVLLSGSISGIWLAPVLFGLAAGLELDLGSYLASRYFGTAHFGSIFAGLFVFHVVGYTVGPLIAAYVRDATGGYSPVLAAITLVLPVVSLLSLTLGRYPTFAGSGAEST